MRHSSSRTASPDVSVHPLKTPMSQSASSLSPEPISKLPSSSSVPTKKLSESADSSSPYVTRETADGSTDQPVQRFRHVGRYTQGPELS